jgi:prepilin-type N-terminal cleavage/methylation domain-containing protein
MTKKQNKGFTLLEILLVIAAIGILAAIVLVAINPNRQIAQARNTVRQADINTIQKAVEQYLIEKGSYPNGITNTYREICNTGSNNNTQGTVSNGCIDLRELVPDYIASIPVNPSTSTHSGYYAWINDVNNKVAVLAGKGENGKVIGINHLKENIVTDGLVLHLDAGNLASYPGTGNTWFDLSGNNNNGALVNGIGYDSTNGGSLSFDGVDDEIFVDNNANINFNGNQQYTALAWVYPLLGGTTWHGIISKGNSQQYALTINSPNAYLHYETNQGGVSPLNSSVSSVLINSWEFVTIRFDGTNKTIWKNGNLLVTQNATSLNSTSNTEQLRIGEGNTGEQFRGNISQVKIYNRSLTPEEIQQNYNTTKGRFGL